MAGQDGAADTGHVGFTLSELDTVTRVAAPTTRMLTNFPNATTLALGFAHSCALTNAGEVFCWSEDHRVQWRRDRVPLPVPWEN